MIDLQDDELALAQAIGKAIAQEAKIVALPINDAMERRAIALKLAIETKDRYTFAEEGLPSGKVIEVAKAYLAFIEGPADA